ncbi:hypothetical protein GCM10010448_49060 [Streptomyces glomeratus]|uniref:Secreted protein n=1 Tax=Streptomyces glomeratus TaxID=284452 RepID=A0ABP6LTB9_9ACTN
MWVLYSVAVRLRRHCKPSLLPAVPTVLATQPRSNGAAASWAHARTTPAKTVVAYSVPLTNTRALLEHLRTQDRWLIILGTPPTAPG